MKAMVLDAPREPLRLDQRDIPQPGPGQLLLKVRACGVCRTDLHVIDGDLKHPKLPLVPGHEVVGVVQTLGDGVSRFSVGQRVGIPWLGRACGHCPYCLQSRENLCDTPLFTGYQIDGGYAEYAVAEADYCFAIPDGYDDIHAAPLLCAGLIGYRAYKATGDRQILGLYGFGAAAHIVAQLAQADGRRVLALTRPGDIATQKFARDLGAEWAGSSYDTPPVLLDAAIIFAPDGGLVPAALKAIRKAGRVVCAGIHMSDIPSFPYDLLWQERELVSIANLTREDGHEFMARAGRQHIDIRAIPYPLAEANAALDDLREGRFDGAAVLVP